MAHRTRKQKINPHHQFSVSWDSNKAVKRQTKTSDSGTVSLDNKAKSAKTSANDDNLKSVRKQALKSLATALLILVIELVIYWKLES